MSAKLPRGFDANWYQKTYSDVSLTGLSPQDHFLLVGQRLGRLPFAPSSAQSAPASGANSARTQKEAAAIIERPAGFDPQSSQPTFPVSKAANEQESHTFAHIQFAPPHADCSQAEAMDIPLASYAAMAGIKTSLPFGGATTDLCNSTLLQDGTIRLSDAWFADAGTLRLRFDAQDSVGLSLQAYQADLDQLDRLQPLDAGVRLPNEGPAFWDLSLRNALAPILIEVLDPTGSSLGVSLLPFPSLLTGGLHYAELKALMVAPNPMQAFWSLSQQLIRTFKGPKPHGICALVAELQNVNGSEPLFRQDVQRWLAGIFHLALDVSPPHQDDSDGIQDLRQRLTNRTDLPPELTASIGTSPNRGARLHLPAGALPTISALTTRDLAKGEHTSQGSAFLVVEAETGRPKWAVSLPAETARTQNVPHLQAIETSTTSADRTGSAQQISPLHLALVPRSAPPPNVAGQLMQTSAPAAVSSSKLNAISVLLEAQDLGRAANLVQSLHSQVAIGAELDLCVRLMGSKDTRQRIATALNALCGENGWRQMKQGVSLKSQITQARHELVFVVKDQVVLFDKTFLPALVDQLNRTPKAASLSGLLIGENIIKNKSVLQSASGGLFPGQVSFATAPQLGVIEPDVRLALGNMTYPVLANTLHCTLFRRDAIANLEASASWVNGDCDLQLGLDLLAADWCNLCNSGLRAGLAGVYRRRDAIDPVGTNYMQIGRWEQIVRSVTLVREIF